MASLTKVDKPRAMVAQGMALAQAAATDAMAFSI